MLQKQQENDSLSLVKKKDSIAKNVMRIVLLMNHKMLVRFHILLVVEGIGSKCLQTFGMSCPQHNKKEQFITVKKCSFQVKI